ncbi:MAG: hypothetical protein LBU27_03135 [Candidatus Peribacteria bacterium]|nr:hypothetical protein [Candidatus Peribacteria bacterium]
MSNPTLISIINLGCTKNLVDSQFLLGKFLSGDFAGKEGGSSEAFQKNPPFLPSPSRSTAGRGTV